MLSAMNEVAHSELKRAIESQHGGTASFVQSVPIHEEHNGQVVWDGTVAVFDLAGHPKATLAHAWSCELPNGRRQFFAVLQIPPITGPLEAVRAAIVAEQKATSRRERRRVRRIENEAYAKQARFWRNAPKSALSLDDHRTGVNRQARGVFKTKPKKQ
jgi:hypothetical protein